MLKLNIKTVTVVKLKRFKIPFNFFFQFSSPVCEYWVLMKDKRWSTGLWWRSLALVVILIKALLNVFNYYFMFYNLLT